METKTKAIVLRRIKYGDSSLIVDMLTEKSGRVSFIVRIPKTQKGKLKKQLFQPLTLLSIVFDNHQRASLQHIRDIAIAYPYTSVTTNPFKASIVMFLAELLTYVTADEQRDERLFTFVEDSLKWLDSCPSDYANFHIVFMMQLSRFIGFWPNIDDYHEGDVFYLREGQFSSLVPIHNDFLSPEDSSLISRLARLNYRTMRLLTVNRKQRDRIIDAIILYYRLHVPGMPELKSLDVLKTLFV